MSRPTVGSSTGAPNEAASFMKEPFPVTKQISTYEVLLLGQIQFSQ